jgi:hypothetical protein
MRRPTRRPVDIADVDATPPHPASPTGVTGVTTLDALRYLWPSDALIVVGSCVERARIIARRDLTDDAARYQFVAPTRAKSIEGGMTTDGHWSVRCAQNFGLRDYLVVEFDDATARQQLSRHAWLSRLPGAPRLVMLVYSGGKSIHGWYYARRTHPDALDEWFGHAIAVGADTATWSLSQWVRMPGGYRPDKGQEQRILWRSPMAVHSDMT